MTTRKTTTFGPFANAEDAEETVAYIGKMAKELSELAATTGNDFLAYLLRMAHDEAAKMSQNGK